VDETSRTIQGKRYRFTRQQILDTMAWYDQQYPDNSYCEPPAIKSWLDNTIYHYAVRHAGRLYPPKFILHRITGLALQGEGLTGGKLTNGVFEDLEFEVIDKPVLPS
jgi:hypothetical protein